MDRQRFQHVKQLVLDTLDQTPASRDRFLSAACDGDDDLRAEVEALLPDGDAELTDQFLAPLPLTSAGHLSAEAELPSRVGLRLGAYELEELIGAGGMGEVYRARRVDDFEQIVAVKLVRHGMVTGDILRRFKNEVQLLASLGEHPNIARLMDAGTTDDGLPYFVMEYVDGQPIDRHCDEHRLNVRQRLELFRTVCSAVQFAHRHAVIHRDIKPSNILVSSDGTPKLIDFGIAKLTAAEGGEHTLPPGTVSQARVFTPHYASPEQMRGEGVTTATDVYSLGIVLYELLSGHRPYQLSSQRPIEWVTIVCEANPRKPSTVLGDRTTTTSAEASAEPPTAEAIAAARGESPRSLERSLRGDLDNIVLMALRKEVERRYASVEQFASDVSRHLNHLPVRARGDSFGYRAQRFLRRNRVAVSLGSLVLISLVVGIVGTATQATRARQAAHLAEQQALRANREAEASLTVANLLAQMFEANSPHQLAGFRVGSVDGSSKQPRLPAPEVLKRSAAQVRADLARRPRLQARLLDSIGNAYVGLGQPKQAEPLLTEALAIRSRELPEDDPERIDSLQSMAWLRFIQGRFADAEHTVREVLEARRATLGQQHAETIMSKFWLATILAFREAHHDEVDALLDQVIAWRREHLGKQHPDVGYALVCRAINQANQDRNMQVALNSVLEAARIFEADQSTQELGKAISDVARSAIEARVGSADRAVALAEEAFEMGRRSLGEDHAFVEVFALYTPRALEWAGRTDAAENLFQAAAERLRAEGRSRGYFYARHLAFLSLLRRGQGREEEGVRLMEEAIEIFREVLGDESYRVVWCQTNMAIMLRNLGRYDEAIALSQRAIEVAEKLETDGFGNIGWCRSQLELTQTAKREAEE
ncbi:MAG: serine/threonine protein kinase [Planctomycetota bacterium]|nr:MAG: serine/threonine protein kinase [Planctomycetota bacterium]